MALPELREAAAADIPAMLEVFFEADEELRASDGRPPRQRETERLRPWFEHHLRHDRATSIVAEDHGRVVAYGVVMVRTRSGFLSELFVAPRWQGRGLGRAVLRECLARAPFERMATCTDAIQPVSTGLYASIGLAPRTPIYVLTGPLDPGALPGPRPGATTAPLAVGAVDALDRSALGYQRPVDHAAWVTEGRRGLTFLDDDGVLAGYGYVHPNGRLGPVLAVDPADLPAFAGELVRSIAGAGDYRCVVPGPARDALRALLAAGLRIDDSPGIYCADHDRLRLDRYLPMSTALL